MPTAASTRRSRSRTRSRAEAPKEGRSSPSPRRTRSKSRARAAKAEAEAKAVAVREPELESEPESEAEAEVEEVEVAASSSRRTVRRRVSSSRVVSRSTSSSSSSSKKKGKKNKSAPAASLWLSDNPAKREGEVFFMWSCVAWVSLMVVIVATRVYESFDAYAYDVVGVLTAAPVVLWPIVFPLKGERGVPFMQRYTTKANLWIWIMAFQANWFWTHYFYKVLGAKYTFPAHRLNDVPRSLYLMSHSYFMLYHVVSNCALRRLWRALASARAGRVAAYAVVTVVIAAMSYMFAFMETWTIQSFPYYELADRHAMYVYGSVFYGIYFIFSFPLFLRLDERAGESWSTERVLLEGMANCMLITTGLDFWRAYIGPIYEAPAGAPAADVPFVL